MIVIEGVKLKEKKQFEGDTRIQLSDGVKDARILFYYFFGFYTFYLDTLK